jgi:hypothetical protein
VDFSPSAPHAILTCVLVELRRRPIRLTPTGVLRLVWPLRLAPWLRFRYAIQKRKATPQHGANGISSHVGDVAQAEVTDIATGTMLSLFIGAVLVCRGALRHQAREHSSSTEDHEQNQRNEKAER